MKLREAYPNKENNMLEEKAKAIQEVAKTTGKAIDASQNLGAFAKQVFGDLLVASSLTLLAMTQI